jgi:hypothetical protein
VRGLGPTSSYVHHVRKWSPGCHNKVSAVSNGDQIQALHGEVLSTIICSAFAALAASVADARAAVPTSAAVAVAPRAVVAVAADLVAVIIGPMPSSLFTSTHLAPRRVPFTLMLPRGQTPRLPPASSLGGPHSDHRGPLPHAFPHAPTKVGEREIERESKSSRSSNSSHSNSSSGGGRSSASVAAAVVVTAAATAAAAAVATATATAAAVPGTATPVGGDQTTMAEVMAPAVQGQRHHQRYPHR